MEKKVLLVDDHPVFRKGLYSLLDNEEDMHVIGEAGDGQTALSLIKELSPDIVVLEVTMPKLNGIEVTKRIVSEFPNTIVVALSIHSGKQFVQDMLQAGAAGYILKESVPEEVVNGIRAVMSGKGYLSSSITGLVVSDYRSSLSRAQDMEKAHIDIIWTKLKRPSMPTDHIYRQRLVDMLDRYRHLPLTLVSAPAGYGKSTLVSSWLETCDCPAAWLSLDENENDLRMFLTYFVNAVQTIIPYALSKTLGLLKASILPSQLVLAGNLVNELDMIEQGFVLAMDDFHLIRNKSVLELIAEVLHHPPRSMHLVLIVRKDPFLPISKLRAQGQIQEIRVHDLRFTTVETAYYLQQMLKEKIEKATAAAWTEKTEGWVTGLRLAALSIQQRGDFKSILSKLEDGLPFVIEYLFNEVLLHQPSDIRNYLMKTSILDRFCAPLCHALCGQSADLKIEEIDSWKFIELLKRENMFIINLDAEGTWFRYHNLFPPVS